MLKNYLFSPLCSAPFFVPALFFFQLQRRTFLLFSVLAFFCFSAPLVFCSTPLFLLSFSAPVSLFFRCVTLYFSAQNTFSAQNVFQPKILLVQPLSSLSTLAFLFSPHHCFSLFLFCFSLCSFCFTCCPLKAHKRV